ncbi:MAG: protein-glutamate O-methyltransferase CheR [Nitrosomonadales bacterium]|nr:protein-glutamate O-methyltransferase CheR [Nitrosomonadales bacterium]
MAYEINDTEFKRFSSLLYDIAGITLTDAKKALLTGRLTKRLNALGMDTFTQYFKHVTDAAHADELQFMVDLLTTNETYFFREPQHFEFLRQILPPTLRQGQVFRVWSAAASIGAEAYTIAMVLADKYGVDGAWEIHGTDINNSVLEQARRGHYRIAEAEKIPTAYLKKYCLKGKGEQQGTFLIDKRLRQHVGFEQLNLNVEGMRKIGDFDVIFLRNVLIYFDIPTKQRVVANLIPSMKNGGYLIVGHSESLNGITTALTQIKPTIYRRL